MYIAFFPPLGIAFETIFLSYFVTFPLWRKPNTISLVQAPLLFRFYRRFVRQLDARSLRTHRRLAVYTFPFRSPFPVELITFDSLCAAFLTEPEFLLVHYQLLPEFLHCPVSIFVSAIPCSMRLNLRTQTPRAT